MGRTFTASDISPTSCGSSTSERCTKKRKLLSSTISDYSSPKIISPQRLLQDRFDNLVEIERSQLQNRVRLNIPAQLSLFPEYNQFNHYTSLFLFYYMTCSWTSRDASGDGVQRLLIELPRIILTPSDSASVCAARALVLCQFGRISLDQKVSSRSNPYFQDALRHQTELLSVLTRSSATSGVTEVESTMKSSAMSNISVQKVDDCIASGMLLAFYVFFRGDCSVSDWVDILSGVLLMMAKRGPEAFSSGWLQVMLNSLRSIFSLYSTIARKSSMLCLPEWRKNFLWTTPVAPLHLITDIMFQVGELEEEVSNVFENAFPPISTLGGLTSYTPDEDEGEVSPRTVPSVKEEYNSAAGWAHQRQLHERLCSLDLKIDVCFDIYKAEVDDYIEWNADDGLKQCVRDKFTHMPMVYTPCSSCTDEEEWIETHFFKPELKSLTMYASRMILTIYYLKTLVTYMKTMTTPAWLLTYDQVQSSAAAWGKSIVRQCVERCWHQIRVYLVVLVRLGADAFTFTGKPVILPHIFPLGDRYTVLQDPLERGWIWDQIQVLRELRNEGSFAKYGDARADSELRMFRSLPTCRECGERVRRIPSQGRKSGSRGVH
ncbi:uncharacterized protein V1516DRAFT_688088 [Lipomyces oligophaga]|uniref:uncharacterized protein n=1 Tax=Lipomyces oligophaga TaxID=45792 RepID=UPI0034CF3F9F